MYSINLVVRNEGVGRFPAMSHVLVRRMVQLASDYGRYGYRRVTALLRSRRLASESQTH